MRARAVDISTRLDIDWENPELAVLDWEVDSRMRRTLIEYYNTSRSICTSHVQIYSLEIDVPFNGSENAVYGHV